MGSKTQNKINKNRLWATTHELAKIGGTANGGVQRLAYSQEDQAGRAYFIDCCLALGMSVERDAIGNLFATFPCEDGNLTQNSVMVGSHLDSQAKGGKYDGAYGVMCGLEIARSLCDKGVELNTPFEIAVWANEEGARFAPPMMGSGVFVGNFQLNEMLATKDLNDFSISHELSNDQILKDMPHRKNREIAAYLEAHIEQGPILENEGKVAGIVTGAQAVFWLNVHIEGFQAHAGPTPMNHRKDAFLAAAEVALKAEAIALTQAPHARATIGQAQVENPSRNVIPGAVELWLDLRHPDETTLNQILDSLKGQCAIIAEQRQVKISFELIWHMEATKFNPDLINKLKAAAKSLNVDSMDMISGAGHDALHMAMKYPTAMLFVPCKDGISHNEAESMEADHAAAGCQILYDAILPLLTRSPKEKGQVL